MPEKKDLQFRLSEGAQRRLDYLASQAEISRVDVVDLALKHLYGTLQRDQPVWVSDPPPPPPVVPEGGPKHAA